MEKISDWSLVVTVVVAFGTLANLYLSTRQSALKDMVSGLKDEFREKIDTFKKDYDKIEKSVRDQLTIFDSRLDAMLRLCDNRMEPVRGDLAVDKNEIVKMQKDLDLCMQFFYDNKSLWNTKAEILEDLKELKNKISRLE